MADKSNIEAMQKISVLLADDHTVVREGLRALVQTQDDLQVVGEAANGREAIELAAKLRPDVVVMDIVMPEVNGLQATREILRSLPSTKIVVLSTYSEDECVQRLVNEGAIAYLVKQTAGADLHKAIREAVKGNAFFSPSISRRLLEHYREAFQHGDQPLSRSTRLTSRETEVLQLIAEGQANKQIAERLLISIKTVEKHRQQVMNKLNIHDVAGLTRHAIAKGMIGTAGRTYLP